MQEMKAYIGGDEALEAIQKARGFKTYRELYNKKITEAENAGRALRESQKEIKVLAQLVLFGNMLPGIAANAWTRYRAQAKHEPNMKQLAMFNDVKKLLNLKASYNKKVLSGGGKAEELGTVLAILLGNITSFQTLIPYIGDARPPRPIKRRSTQSLHLRMLRPMFIMYTHQHTVVFQYNLHYKYHFCTLL